MFHVFCQRNWFEFEIREYFKGRVLLERLTILNLYNPKYQGGLYENSRPADGTWNDFLKEWEVKVIKEEWAGWSTSQERLYSLWRSIEHIAKKRRKHLGDLEHVTRQQGPAWIYCKIIHSLQSVMSSSRCRRTVASDIFTINLI